MAFFTHGVLRLYRKIVLGQVFGATPSCLGQAHSVHHCSQWYAHWMEGSPRHERPMKELLQTSLTDRTGGRRDVDERPYRPVVAGCLVEAFGCVYLHDRHTDTKWYKRAYAQTSTGIHRHTDTYIDTHTYITHRHTYAYIDKHRKEAYIDRHWHTEAYTGIHRYTNIHRHIETYT
jgi:hypothetical protein